MNSNIIWFIIIKRGDKKVTKYSLALCNKNFVILSLKNCEKNKIKKKEITKSGNNTALKFIKIHA